VHIGVTLMDPGERCIRAPVHATTAYIRTQWTRKANRLRRRRMAWNLAIT